MPFSVLAALTAVSFQLHAAELPADIEWVSNNNEPLFASEEAVYGGTYRTYIEVSHRHYAVLVRMLTLDCVNI